MAVKEILSHIKNNCMVFYYKILNSKIGNVLKIKEYLNSKTKINQNIWQLMIMENGYTLMLLQIKLNSEFGKLLHLINLWPKKLKLMVKKFKSGWLKRKIKLIVPFKNSEKQFLTILLIELLETSLCFKQVKLLLIFYSESLL